MNSRRSGFPARIIAMLAVGLAFAGACANAQTWQSMFGGAQTEDGRGGVKPLLLGGGYISVGTTNSFGQNNDVYVVEENLAGGIVWAFAYDFHGNDYGLDIQELAGGGFIITGRTDVNGSSDLLLLKINAAGGVVWGETFGGTNYEAGTDVLEAANGDYVAVGEAHLTPANQDGLMVRTNAAGAPIFVRTYAPAGNPANEDLRGLYEAANGDLIACGATTSFGNGMQGWVMRTTNAGIPIWSNHVGLGANENFNSVIELTVGAQAGNIVAVGATTGTPSPDFYVAKFNGGGGMIVPDIAGGGNPSVEEMFQVREMKVVGVPGDLLLTGHMNPGPLGGDDGYAVDMTPVWGCPSGKNWSMAYGGNGLDQLYSGAEVATNCLPGFILCGLTQALAVPPDPQQMYVIKTGLLGVSGCHEARPVDNCNTPGYPSVAAPMLPASASWGTIKPVAAIPGRVTQNLCFAGCPPPPAPHAPEVTQPATPAVEPWYREGTLSSRNVRHPDQGIAAVAADEEASAATMMYPNPVAEGSSFEVRYNLGVGAQVSVVISDAYGRIVYQRAADAKDGSGFQVINTTGWAMGSYLVRVDGGTGSQTKRIVVTGR
ncbi:MAG TPA: T9SS type A sorting domain-containing protein [Candidatus Kapabacteria bacterium]|nr:T9SS type A sorting domain-containing protein [Candidatus Kapabacteria bacterium]